MEAVRRQLAFLEDIKRDIATQVYAALDCLASEEHAKARAAQRAFIWRTAQIEDLEQNIIVLAQGEFFRLKTGYLAELNQREEVSMSLQHSLSEAQSLCACQRGSWSSTQCVWSS
jgi:hypothetical protein